MPACPSSPVSPVVAHLASAAEANELVGTGLLAVLATVPDPHKPRGVRHQITTILALGACAVLCGVTKINTYPAVIGGSGPVRSS